MFQETRNVMNFNQAITDRVFIVGCARSGTTLLQSILGAHTHIATFPESHFFQHAVPGHKWARRLGLASRAARGQLNCFLRESGHTELISGKTFPIETLLRVTNVFVRNMDEMAIMEGKDIWLEKTPGHLYHIPTITELVPKSRFIHIIRGGKDVVSSLYAVTREHKGAWGRPMEIDECMYWWKEAISLSSRYLNQPNHFFVHYESLIEDPQSSVSSICDFLNIDFQEEMLLNYPNIAKKVTLSNEPWKRNVTQKIHFSNRFHELFSPETRKYIIEQLQSTEDEITGWSEARNSIMIRMCA